MYRLARPDEWGLAIASLALLVGAGAWIVYSNSGPHIANDYEECAEDAQANAASRPDYFKLHHTLRRTLCGPTKDRRWIYLL